MTYFDTSALIKYFVVEKGSDLAQRLVQAHSPTATGSITYAEV